MNNSNNLLKISKIMNDLEKNGLYKEADSLSNIIKRISQVDEPNVEDFSAEVDVPTQKMDETTEKVNKDDIENIDTEESKIMQSVKDYEEFENFAKEIIPATVTQLSDLNKINIPNLDKLSSLAKKVNIAYLPDNFKTEITNSIIEIESLKEYLSQSNK